MKPEDIAAEITKSTRLVVMTHASNVCGTILPLKEVGKICRENRLFFIIDAAQTAGVFDIDMEELNADAIAFTGHKGLLGPQGIGGFVIGNRLIQATESIICGGTGSDSESELQPEYMPDKYEAGTMNLPGIYGLNAAIKYLNKIGINNIRERELELTKSFLEGAGSLKGVRAVGMDEIEGRTAVVSLDFFDNDNGEIAYLLDRDYGIKTRCGLHCAPSAHKTLGTYPHGTVRFSFSHFNTNEDIDHALESINKILKSL